MLALIWGSHEDACSGAGDGSNAKEGCSESGTWCLKKRNGLPPRPGINRVGRAGVRPPPPTWPPAHLQSGDPSHPFQTPDGCTDETSARRSRGNIHLVHFHFLFYQRHPPDRDSPRASTTMDSGKQAPQPPSVFPVSIERLVPRFFPQSYQSMKLTPAPSPPPDSLSPRLVSRSDRETPSARPKPSRTVAVSSPAVHPLQTRTTVHATCIRSRELTHSVSPSKDKSSYDRRAARPRLRLIPPFRGNGGAQPPLLT